MSCKSVSDLLPLFDDPELGSDERAAVAAHLADCPTCTRELENIRAAQHSLVALRAVDIPVYGKERVLARAREINTPWSWRHMRRLLTTRLPVAGTLVACLMVIAVWSWLPTLDAPTDTASPEEPMTFMFAQEDAASFTTMRMLGMESLSTDVVTMVVYSEDADGLARRLLAELETSGVDALASPTELEGGGVQVRMNGVDPAVVHEALLTLEDDEELMVVDPGTWRDRPNAHQSAWVTVEIRPSKSTP